MQCFLVGVGSNPGLDHLYIIDVKHLPDELTHGGLESHKLVGVR